MLLLEEEDAASRKAGERNQYMLNAWDRVEVRVGIVVTNPLVGSSNGIEGVIPDGHQINEINGLEDAPKEIKHVN